MKPITSDELEGRQKLAALRFDLLHGEGSADKLLAMASDDKSLSEVAAEFNLSPQRISILYQNIAGRLYREK